MFLLVYFTCFILSTTPLIHSGPLVRPAPDYKAEAASASHQFDSAASDLFPALDTLTSCSFYAALFVANAAQVTNAMSDDNNNTKAMADVVAQSKSASKCSTSNANEVEHSVFQLNLMAHQLQIRKSPYFKIIGRVGWKSQMYSFLALSMSAITTRNTIGHDEKQRQIYQKVNTFNIRSTNKVFNGVVPYFPSVVGSSVNASHPYCVFYDGMFDGQIYCRK